MNRNPLTVLAFKTGTIELFLDVKFSPYNHYRRHQILENSEFWELKTF